MCTGIALTLTEVPAALAEDHADRVLEREGHRELQLHWWQTPPLLPVYWDGRLQLLRWGSKVRRSPLPYGGWLTFEQLRSSTLAEAQPEEVIVPANLGFHGGTWFLIDEGIRGVVLPEAQGGPVVYMLTEPPTNYYRNMTGRPPFMPALVGQVI